MKRRSNYDRLMILSRTKEFREGLSAITGRFYPDENAAFSATWGVDAALLEEYLELCEYADGLQEESVFVAFSDFVNALPLFPSAKSATPVKVIRQRRDLMEVTEATRYDIEGFPKGIKSLRIFKSLQHSDTRHLRDNRFLTIEVDLHASKTEIIKAFTQSIEHYQESLKRSDTRSRQTTIDVWAAYRWHVEQGMALHEIAAKIIEAAPKLFNGDDPMAAAQQAVHRAVQKARFLLSQPTPTP